jgi:hypothetical protein
MRIPTLFFVGCCITTCAAQMAAIHSQQSMRPEREKCQEGSYSCAFPRLRHRTQRSNHVQVFLARQKGIKIGFLGDVAEGFSIRDKVFVDVLVIVSHFAVSGLEQAREHFYGCALARTVRTQIAENLSGLDSEGDALNGRDGAIEFAQVFRREHGTVQNKLRPCGCMITGPRHQETSVRAIRPIRSSIADRLPLDILVLGCRPEGASILETRAARDTATHLLS